MKKLAAASAIVFVGLVAMCAIVVATLPSSPATPPSCFSAWDGAHRTLQDRVKAQLKDPDSYEHIETRYTGTEESPVRITTSFRARNSFGGYVVNRAVAEGGADCSVSNVVIE